MKSANSTVLGLTRLTQLVAPDLRVRKIINHQHHTAALINFVWGFVGGGNRVEPVNRGWTAEANTPRARLRATPKRAGAVGQVTQARKHPTPANQARTSAIRNARAPTPKGNRCHGAPSEARPLPPETPHSPSINSLVWRDSRTRKQRGFT